MRYAGGGKKGTGKDLSSSREVDKTIVLAYIRHGYGMDKDSTKKEGIGKELEIKEIGGILKKHKPFLKEKYQVKNIGVFGSYVRGEQDQNSDLDVLVEFDKRIGFFKFLELEEYLQELLQLKVDLVSKKALKPVIGRYILKEVVMI